MARTSLSNKMVPCPIYILTPVLTSMLIFLVVGLGMLLTMTPLIPWLPQSHNLTPCDFFLMGVTTRVMCTWPLCHMIYLSCDKGLWRQSLLSTMRCCNVCGRNFITRLASAALPWVDISRTCKVGQKLGVSPLLLTC